MDPDQAEANGDVVLIVQGSDVVDQGFAVVKVELLLWLLCVSGGNDGPERSELGLTSMFQQVK